MKTKQQIETENNYPFMVSKLQKELAELRQWLKTCPFDYNESVLKSGSFDITFHLIDV